MKWYLIILLTFLSTNIFAQVDSVEASQLTKLQSPSEKKFISFLKANSIDSCLALISTETIQKIGVKELRNELHKISGFFKKYGEPKHQLDWGKPLNTVGPFGHDVHGTIEKESSYTFVDKNGKPVYNFNLYYWNSQNVGIIKYFEAYVVPEKSYIEAAPSPSY
jgi:hypothetical protein